MEFRVGQKVKFKKGCYSDDDCETCCDCGISNDLFSDDGYIKGIISNVEEDGCLVKFDDGKPLKVQNKNLFKLMDKYEERKQRLLSVR